MRRAAIILFVLGIAALLVVASRQSEPRIHLRPEESPTRAINRVASGLSESDAAEFREAANRLMIHAAWQPGDKLRNVAVHLDGKSVSEVIAAYRALPPEAREAANNVLQFDGQ